MSRFHGKDAKAYLGSRDVSCDIHTVGFQMSAESHDVTCFCDSGWKTYDGGLASWQAPISGFYDPAVGGFGRQLEDLLGTTGGILSVYLGGADAVGDEGILGSDSILDSRGQPINVADLIKLNGSLRGSGRASMDARLLHVKGDESATGTGTSYDAGAATTDGGRGSIHVFSVSGTWTLKIDHSVDNSVWVTLITFTAVTAVTSQTVEVTGTVNRYLRLTHTEDVAGAINDAGGFARY